MIMIITIEIWNKANCIISGLLMKFIVLIKFPNEPYYINFRPLDEAHCINFRPVGEA